MFCFYILFRFCYIDKKKKSISFLLAAVFFMMSQLITTEHNAPSHTQHYSVCRPFCNFWHKSLNRPQRSFTGHWLKSLSVKCNVLCVCIYIYIYIYIHTQETCMHTHTYLFLFSFFSSSLDIFLLFKKNQTALFFFLLFKGLLNSFAYDLLKCMSSYKVFGIF